MTGLNNSRMAGGSVLPPGSGEDLVCRGAGDSLDYRVPVDRLRLRCAEDSPSVAFDGCKWVRLFVRLSSL